LRESKMRLCKTLKKMNSSGDWEKAVTNEPNQDDGACVAGLTLAEMSVTLPIIRSAEPTVGCPTIFASVSVRQAGLPLLRHS